MGLVKVRISSIFVNEEDKGIKMFANWSKTVRTIGSYRLLLDIQDIVTEGMAWG